MPRVGGGRCVSRLGSVCPRSPALSRAKPPLPPFSAPVSPSPRSLARSLTHRPVRAPARPPARLLPGRACARSRRPSPPGGGDGGGGAPQEGAPSPLRPSPPLLSPPAPPGAGRGLGAAGAQPGAAGASAWGTGTGTGAEGGAGGAREARRWWWRCRPGGPSPAAGALAAERGPRSGAGGNKGPGPARPPEQKTVREEAGAAPPWPLRARAGGNVCPPLPSSPPARGQRSGRTAGPGRGRLSPVKAAAKRSGAVPPGRPSAPQLGLPCLGFSPRTAGSNAPLLPRALPRLITFAEGFRSTT